MDACSRDRCWRLWPALSRTWIPMRSRPVRRRNCGCGSTASNALPLPARSCWPAGSTTPTSGRPTDTDPPPTGAPPRPAPPSPRPAPTWRCPSGSPPSRRRPRRCAGARSRRPRPNPSRTPPPTPPQRRRGCWASRDGRASRSYGPRQDGPRQQPIQIPTPPAAGSTAIAGSRPTPMAKVPGASVAADPSTPARSWRRPWVPSSTSSSTQPGPKDAENAARPTRSTLSSSSPAVPTNQRSSRRTPSTSACCASTSQLSSEAASTATSCARSPGSDRFPSAEPENCSASRSSSW